MDEKRVEWAEGQVEAVRLGTYGNVVHLEVTASGVRVRTTTPRRQEVIGPDTPQARQLALSVADNILAIRNGGRRAAARQRPVRPVPNGILSPREIWLAYLRRKLGRLPEDVFGWGRADIARHYATLTPGTRTSLPSVDTVNNILVAARALDRRGIVPLDCDIDCLHPGTISDELQAWVNAGVSAATVSTYWRRFRWLVRKFKGPWRDRWGQRRDLTADVELPTSGGPDTEEIGEDRASSVIRQLRDDGEWQAVAAMKVVHASGRRIGAIAGYRPGLHLDAPPLAAQDFVRNQDGRLMVTWRANVQKGRAYRRGDVTQVCPQELEVVYRWLKWFHPNPLGPEHPLIWDADDPSMAASYDSLTRAFAMAWERAYGEPKPKGLAWHAVIRTTVTTIVSEASVEVAGEHTGRDPETILRHYLMGRSEHQECAVEVLDRRHRQRHRPSKV